MERRSPGSRAVIILDIHKVGTVSQFVTAHIPGLHSEALISRAAFPYPSTPSKTIEWFSTIWRQKRRTKTFKRRLVPPAKTIVTSHIPREGSSTTGRITTLRVLTAFLLYRRPLTRQRSSTCGPPRRSLPRARPSRAVAKRAVSLISSIRGCLQVLPLGLRQLLQRLLR
jgi:hypothetical protein